MPEFIIRHLYSAFILRRSTAIAKAHAPAAGVLAYGRTIQTYYNIFEPKFAWSFELPDRSSTICAITPN